MSKIAILILAAGSSSRMEKTKQLLPFKHTTLLGWAIEQALESEADEVICILGAEVDQIEKSVKNYDVKIIYNKNYKNGISSSITIGIKNLENTEAVLIMLADQPDVTYSYINELLEVSSKNPSKIIASKYGTSVGVPAVFPKKYFSELLDLKGDKGAKQFLLSHASEVLSLNIKEKLIDIDTQEDYNKLVK